MPHTPWRSIVTNAKYAIYTKRTDNKVNIETNYSLLVFPNRSKRNSVKVNMQILIDIFTTMDRSSIELVSWSLHITCVNPKSIPIPLHAAIYSIISGNDATVSFAPDVNYPKPFSRNQLCHKNYGCFHAADRYEYQLSAMWLWENNIYKVTMLVMNWN